MRPIEFLFNVIDRFAPMNEPDKAELRRDANQDYLAVKETVFDTGGKVKDEKKFNLKQKAVRWSENWVVRTFMAVGFIWIVPVIQRYMNPPEFEDFGDEDEIED